MADVCGPFTLEDLDQFGGLDSLAFSLDDSIWSSATTCIFDVSASATGSGVVNLSATRERTSSASASGSASVSFSAIRERLSSASISGAATVDVTYARVRDSSANVSTASSVYMLGGMSFSGYGDLVASSFAYARLYGTLKSSASISGSASATGSGRIVGEDWGVQQIGDNSWASISVGSNVWTTDTQGNNTWQPSASI